MNGPLVKKTLLRTLKWYPLVILVMAVVGTAIAMGMGNLGLSILLIAIGAILGPGIEAAFYYQGELKKQQRAKLPTSDPADRLRQAAQLLHEGLIGAEAYEKIRQAVLAELESGKPVPSISNSPAPSAEPLPVPETQPGTTSPVMKINPWLAILVAFSWPMMGFLLSMVLEMLLDIELSKLVRSLLNLLVGAFGAFYLFPVLYQAPFGKVPLKEYLERIGVYLPTGAWRHFLLGILLAACTLSGMLVASLLTGRYRLDWSTINLSHIVFSLNPGIWEEIFYRGILVILLLLLTKSLMKALVWQIIIFGLAHIKGLDLVALVDAFSVMVIAAAFTYSAYKTRSLLAGMVFHFLHDALLFFVQVPEGIYIGLQENLIFYGILWLMVGVGCLIIWYAADRLKIRGERELYRDPALA